MAEKLAEKLADPPEVRAQKRTEQFNGLMWHLASFTIINGLLWFLDLVSGGGLNWAFWVTLFWGIGVAFHVADNAIGNGDTTSSRYHRYLEEERQRLR